MDIEKSLKEFKKQYQRNEPSKTFMEEGWQDLQDKMMHLLQANKRKSFFYSRPVIMAVLTVFILAGVLGGVVKASQNALPGEPFYPVKRFTEDIVIKVSGNPVIEVENRGQEVLELSKKGERSTADVQKAVEEYETAVREASQSSVFREEFEEKLTEQEQEFEEAKEGPSIKEIEEAIEISKSGRGGGENEQKDTGKDDRSGSNKGN